MAVEIFLARHGQYLDNLNQILNGHRDLPLTDLGREQARQLGRGILKLGIKLDKIYSSPLIRAYETAVIVSAELGLKEKPEVIRELIERDFGVMTGRPIPEVVEACRPNVLETHGVTYALDIEGGEAYPQLVERGHRVLDHVRSKHKDGKVLLVSHGDFGKMIYAAATGKDWKQVLQQFHFGNAELIDISGDNETHVIHIEQYNL